ncbi:hypothetical protein PO124_01110 [Bacillus licheniformis]|nr:hypothetical protein [Bacillus licheniformis]
MKTDPAAGDIVKEGSTVKLYKSSGKEKLKSMMWSARKSMPPRSFLSKRL